MFPSGRAGIALLILRTSIATALLFAAVMGAKALLLIIASVCIAAFLCVGFGTPIFAGLCSVGAAFVAFRSSGTSALCPALFGLTSLALTLLGPGAYSLDARVFGRRIVFTNRDKDRNQTNL